MTTKRVRKRPLAKTLRLNARIDAGLAKKLERLAKEANKSSSEVVCDAISAYYDAHTNKSAYDALVSCGLVDSLTAEPTLSERYKKAILNRIGDKT